MKSHYLEYFLKDYQLTVICTLIFLLLSIVFYKLKNRNLPPGPWGLPLVGYWPFLHSKSVHLQLQDLMKKYGEIYAFNVAGQLYIHLGSIKSIKEAHLTKTDCFTGRSSNFTSVFCFFTEGVVSANGEPWKILRKFFIQRFREYGLNSGKEVSGFAYDSANLAIESLRNTNEAPFDIMPILTLYSSTILRRMLFNDEGITTEELFKIREEYETLADVFVDKKIFLAGNFAKYVILPLNSRFKSSRKSFNKIDVILRDIIKRHEESLDEQSIRNVIDSYYKERNERKKRGDPTAMYFTDKALLSSLLQFTGDGILGVVGFITYNICALLEYPDEQEKIYKELEDVIGTNRQPSLEDKNNLPYTNAFLLEVIRTSDFVTVFPSLECTTETTLGGYRIPKGAITVMNFWTSHRDPHVYDAPDTFQPSRFLKEPGKEKAELPVLFGVGKRSCLGESFIAMQTFLFIASLMKNFRLELPEGESNKSFLEGKMKIIAHPRMNK